MTGRERIASAIRCEEVDRVPWVPFAGCHAGALIDVPADDYLRSSDAIVRGVTAAIERDRPDGVPVVFDLQIEAEALGCELVWAPENPPAVKTHPLEAGAALGDLSLPGPADGRIGVALEAARELRTAHPEVALYGLVTGPFTLALHLLGTQIFMEMYDDPDAVHALLDFARQVSTAMSGWYAEAGCDVVAVVDPMTSQIGPEPFREFVTPAITPVFDAIREAGALGSFFVCGDAQQNIEAMCDCRPDNLSVDENIPLDFVREIALPRRISFGGNLQLTSVLLLGTELDAKRNAIACLETAGERGFILAPGCDLPYATPPANLEAVAVVVHDAYEREVVRTMEATEAEGERLDMREYGLADRVIVDVITLDSEACAPCQYMVEAVKAAAPEFEGIVEWREHKIKQRESLVFMTSLMVKNIPTICIDGKITFVSRIPKREELIAAIQNRIFEKLKMKIRRRRATLYVLGESEADCAPLEENARRAATELGAEVEIERVTDARRIAEFGLAMQQTPAAVLARYQVKSTRYTPEPDIIREWFKELL